jgi:uncharacterized protein (TIGR03437 family)
MNTRQSPLITNRVVEQLLFAGHLEVIDLPGRLCRNRTTRMAQGRLRIALWLLLAAVAQGSQNRVPGTIEDGETVALERSLRPDVMARRDLGPADPNLWIDDAILLVKPTPQQQAELDELMARQQDRRSPDFRRWLSPEQFADRFGLSRVDANALAGWLRRHGVTVNAVARGRHWVTFSGSAHSIGNAFQTEIHRYQVNGELHYANATALRIPAVLKGVVGAVEGLHDFRPRHASTTPKFSLGGVHSLAPDDLATIYDIRPLYDQGIDGTGQRLAVIGASQIDNSDLEAYQREFGLPVREPEIVLFGADPGRNAGRGEAEGDLEVAVSVARNATLVYAYGGNTTSVTANVIDQRLATVITWSYVSCENSVSPATRILAQQASVLGITWMASAGDSGPANCDPFYQSSHPAAVFGPALSWPASMPEVTAVGGTEFREDGGNYWSAQNSANGASALAYIPEAAWNDTSFGNGIEAGGGGASVLFAKPAWQNGPGVPNDGARDVPDVSLSASSIHDPYRSYFDGTPGAYNGGTSASSPAFAGMVALLNQYLVAKGEVSAPGLGNINPSLYRLAQTSPAAFHDVADGDTFIPCVPGSTGCTTGNLGYRASPGYDLATGLGSVDLYQLAQSWNLTTPSQTILKLNVPTLNSTGTVQLTATVSGAGGTPTGDVSFLTAGTVLGASPLSPAGTASLSISGYSLLAGANAISAVYNGDNNYGASSASASITVNLPAGGSAVALRTSPNPVTAQSGPDGAPQWPALIVLQNLTSTPTTVTALSVDGIDYTQRLAVILGSTNLGGKQTLSGVLMFTNLTTPVNRIFAVSGVDAGGQAWTTQTAVAFLGLDPKPLLSLALDPPVAAQNSANASCGWQQQLTLTSREPPLIVLSKLTATSDDGQVTDFSGSLQQIFATTRLAGDGYLQGTVCWSGTAVPQSQTYAVTGTLVSTITTVAAAATGVLGPPPSMPASLTVSPAALSLTGTIGSTLAASSKLSVNCGSGASWSVTPHIANQAEQGWLTVVPQTDGVLVQASASALPGGGYAATLTVVCAAGTPQVVNVPVAFTVNPSTALQIAGVSNAASYGLTLAPGAMASIFGSNLAPATSSAISLPLPGSLNGVKVFVNEFAASLYYVSASQINFQMPYVTGNGTAVVTVNNNGAIATAQFPVAAAAPGIFTDVAGNLVPQPTASRGQTIVVYVTGDGDERPFLAVGAASDGTAHPLLPVSVTVAGQPAAVLYAGIPSGLAGVTQVNFTIPADAPLGSQFVIVTVGGTPSQKAVVTIQ